MGSPRSQYASPSSTAMQPGAKATASQTSPPSKRLKPRTLLHWGASTTKAFLAAAWAIYITSDTNDSKLDQERISFSTPLRQIIREDFVLPDVFATEAMTLEDVLFMRPGMARHELSYGREGVCTSQEVVRNLRSLPIHMDFRSTFEYCNTGYAAATDALEIVTGRALVDVVRDWVWEPLGMRSTIGVLGEVVAKGQGHRIAGGKQVE